MRLRTRFQIAALCVAAPFVLQAQKSSNGFAADRLARIDKFLQAAVDSNRIMGATALVLRDGKPVYEKSVGWADKESNKKMTSDVIFRIASQSKALTSTAIMMLIEQGAISLNDPVGKFIPSFERTTVALAADTGRTPVRANRQINIKDLLTHTAGISYGGEARVSQKYVAAGLGPAAGWGWYFADKTEPICTTIERLGTLPMVYQPGETWVYGYNTDILGCVVERASGMSLDQFIKTRITGPLGMKDTHFFLPVEKRERLATVYMSDSTNHAVRAPNGPRGQGDYVDGPRVSFSGGAGLLSTARDYAHFLEMLRNHGQLDGVRYLSPKTVDLMTTNQTTLYRNWGQGYGLAFETVEKYGGDGMSSVGTFTWGGAYASTYRVDPAEGLVMVFMINQLPMRSDVPAKFATLVYQAMTTSRSGTQR